MINLKPTVAFALVFAWLLTSCSPPPASNKHIDQLTSKIVAPTPIVTNQNPSPQPIIQEPTATTPKTYCLDIHSVSIREGPGQEYDLLGYIVKGDCVVPLGRSKNNAWIKINNGWVFSYYLVPDNELSELPILNEFSAEVVMQPPKSNILQPTKKPAPTKVWATSTLPKIKPSNTLRPIPTSTTRRIITSTPFQIATITDYEKEQWILNFLRDAIINYPEQTRKAAENLPYLNIDVNGKKVLITHTNSIFAHKSLSEDDVVQLAADLLFTAAMASANDARGKWGLDEIKFIIPDNTAGDAVFYLSGAINIQTVGTNPQKIFDLMDFSISQPSRQQTISGCPNGCAVPPPGCNIKGNISYGTGEKIYHVPGQDYYNETTINPDYGERWFCTEEEARSNGWRKAFQ